MAEGESMKVDRKVLDSVRSKMTEMLTEGLLGKAKVRVEWEDRADEKAGSVFELALSIRDPFRIAGIYLTYPPSEHHPLGCRAEYAADGYARCLEHYTRSEYISRVSNQHPAIEMHRRQTDMAAGNARRLWRVWQAEWKCFPLRRTFQRSDGRRGPGGSSLNGELFRVLRTFWTHPETAEETGEFMYRIRFDALGVEIDAWPEEVLPPIEEASTTPA